MRAGSDRISWELRKTRKSSCARHLASSSCILFLSAAVMETGLTVSATPRPLFVEGFLAAGFLVAGFFAFMTGVAACELEVRLFDYFFFFLALVFLYMSLAESFRLSDSLCILP
jgi:hypothetical protein